MKCNSEHKKSVKNKKDCSSKKERSNTMREFLLFNLIIDEAIQGHEVTKLLSGY